MNNKAILNKVKELLGMEVKLEQRKLEDGVTVIEADAFEPDNEVMIVTEDEQMIPLPVGEYVMEGGEQVLVVTEEGLISEIKTEEAEEEAPAEEVEVEAAEEEKEEMGYATKEELAEVKQMIEEIKAMLEPKEDLSAEELGNLITEELCKHEKVELSEVPEEVQEELNQPAAEPIQANPETKQNLSKFNISQNRRMSTLDRVMAKFN